MIALASSDHQFPTNLLRPICSALILFYELIYRLNSLIDINKLNI